MDFFRAILPGERMSPFFKNFFIKFFKIIPRHPVFTPKNFQSLLHSINTYWTTFYFGYQITKKSHSIIPNLRKMNVLMNIHQPYYGIVHLTNFLRHDQLFIYHYQLAFQIRHQKLPQLLHVLILYFLAYYGLPQPTGFHYKETCRC
ncbi:hypothetical protein CCP3SC15_1650005 [Gammaproteobacteria bacterium]